MAFDEILILCNEKTFIIPGHGSLSNRQGLEDYRELMINSRDRILKLIKEGKTLDEIIEFDPLKNLYKGGESWLPPKLFIFTIYQDLAKK